jgi:FtsP/CotA-like multicopper oxidase with cupredoxin domain
MQFRVVPLASPDTSTPPAELALPAPPALGPESRTRALSLNEEDSRMLCVSRQGGTVPCGSSAAVDAFGPVRALLGTMDGDASPIPLLWDDAVTENPDLGATEVWELYNFTADAHPIHVHLVQFEVVNRQSLAGDDGMAEPPARLTGDPRGPEPWETGRKDTVIAYPGEVTRVKARFDRAGLYVWHCHILEHEDNEMMRPLRVGP